MTTVELIQSSQYWSDQYSNFQAFQPGARDWLKENGLIVVDNYDLKDSGICTDSLTKVVIGFNKHEPDYGAYRESRQAKEARPSYTPDYGRVMKIEEFYNLPSQIAKREKEQKKTKTIETIKKELPQIIEKYKEVAKKELTEKREKKIEKINGRKYQYSIRNNKFETIEKCNEYIDCRVRSELQTHYTLRIMKDTLQEANDGRLMYILDHYNELMNEWKTLIAVA